MICRDCKFAEWRLTEKGNVRRKAFGICTYPLPEMPPLPICMDFDWPQNKKVIWWDYEDECPVGEL